MEYCLEKAHSERVRGQKPQINVEAFREYKKIDPENIEDFLKPSMHARKNPVGAMPFITAAAETAPITTIINMLAYGLDIPPLVTGDYQDVNAFAETLKEFTAAYG